MAELTIADALNLGVEAHKAGKVQEADRYYTAILEAQPEHPDANHNLGVLAVGLGKQTQALPFFEKALEANASIDQYWLSYVDALVKLKKLDDAQIVIKKAKANGLSDELIKRLEGITSSQNIGSDRSPSQEEVDQLMALYNQGQLAAVVGQTQKLIEQYPHAFVIWNILGAANKGLGRLNEAVAAFQKATQLNPSNPDGHNNLGTALQDQGKLAEAIEAYQEALSLKPDYAEAYNNMGNTLKEQNELEESIEAYKKALSLKPDYAEAYNNMSNTLKDQGKLEEAIEVYKKALYLKPDYAEAYNNMGNALKSQGKLKAAIEAYDKALSINPDYAEVYNNIGNALQEQCKLGGAIEAFNKALSLKSNYAEAYYNMGNALQEQGKLEEAIEAFNKTISLKPDCAEAYNNMGTTLQELGKLAEAMDAFNKALSLKPDYAETYNNMGTTLKDQGKLEEAIEAYNKALSLKPDYAEAYRNHSNLHTYTVNDEYFAKMQALFLNPNIRAEKRCYLSFSLSKAFEDLNEVSQQFTYLEMGNKLRKKMLAYDIRQDIYLFNQLKKSYPSIAKAALQSVGKKNELTPIFIIGMPRSGTTLVEQIVSSHSKVTGAGELGYVSKLGKSIANGTIEPNAEMISDFRQRYIEALKNRSDNRSIVTDKMPHNFRYLGLIFSAFPDAIVIHVNREPAATCWSNYKHYFSTKELGYSYDLDDVVTYFCLYKDLMRFWQEYYGDRIYNLNYDKLTINQEDETRMLIQYIGLEWEDCCLFPHNNKRSVRTASQQQVRKKVYQGSSQAWRKFEPYLNGAFDQFESKV